MLPEAAGVEESEVAEPLFNVFIAPRVFQVVPLSVETWKVTVPVGVPAEPETVTEAVTEVPRVIGLQGFKVGVETVGLTVNTVKVAVIVPAPLIVAVVEAEF